MRIYPWQTTLYQQLTNTFSQQRGHHAHLFRTEVGLGTTSLVYYFAHFLLCQNRRDVPCEQCKSCQLFNTNNHPDFHYIAPIDNKTIGVDQIREISVKLQQFAQQGGNIVVMIDRAEMLTEASSNALLKTLEEPNDNVYFLLVADIQSSLLATIQSRCQTWVLHAPNQQVTLSWLEPQFSEITTEDLLTALRISHNRPLACKSMLENDRLLVRKTFLRNFWLFFKHHNVLKMLRAFSLEKEAILEQLAWLESFISDALKAKLGIYSGWINADLQAGIEPFSQAFSAPQLLKSQQIVQQISRDLREINAVNSELMLLDGLTKLVLTIFEGRNESR